MLKVSVLIVVVIALFTPELHAKERIELVIDRSEHSLQVQKNGATLKTFKVAFGNGGRKAKLRQGDHRTPLGTYRIRVIRSSDSFHLFVQLNYPNVKDAIRGLDNNVITKAQYNAILDAHIESRLPPQNTALGGQIGIHGIGNETEEKIEIHDFIDWTKGCIAMRNHEIEELSRFIEIGTRVRIVE